MPLRPPLRFLLVGILDVVEKVIDATGSTNETALVTLVGDERIEALVA